MDNARADGSEGVGDGHLRVVVTVNAEGDINLLRDCFYNIFDFVRETAAVCITQNEAVRFTCRRCAQRLHRVFPVVFIPVKEMFRVVDKGIRFGLEIAQRRVNNLKILFERNIQGVAGMNVPGLSEDCNNRGFRPEKLLDVCVAFRGDFCAAGTAEGRDPGGCKGFRLGLFKKIRVLGIGPRPPALDIVDSQVI